MARGVSHAAAESRCNDRVQSRGSAVDSGFVVGFMVGLMVGLMVGFVVGFMVDSSFVATATRPRSHTPGRSSLPKIFDVKQWPRVLWQNPVLFGVALLLGATSAFVYSYAPLHRAKDWKLDYLEERLSIRTNQARELEQELQQARSALEGTPSGEQLGALRAQLEEATTLAAAHKKEMAALARKLESAERSRNKWKSRSSQASAELEEARRSTEAEAMAATTDPLEFGATAPVAPSDAEQPEVVEPGPASPASDRGDE